MTDPDAPLDAPPRPRPGLRTGARLGAGAATAAIAVLAIVLVGLVPIPTRGADAPAVEVTPDPAAMLRACSGGLVRLGTETGEDAGRPVPVGTATVSAAATEGTLERIPLAAGITGPELLRLAPGGGALAGAQTQSIESRDLTGLAAASCAEPSGSVWLVGGGTTVGRSSVLVLTNPSEVDATVEVAIWGEQGEVAAPGLSGIRVPAGDQRVLSLAGFAPGVASPVVHVAARGGGITATLQHSIVRGLDATGVEHVGPSPAPATEAVIPGVRIIDAIGISRALGLEDWVDLQPALRLLAPGEEPARATVQIVPHDPDGHGASFELDLEPGRVQDVTLPLVEELVEEGGARDADFTVFVTADEPVLAAVRASTAIDPGDAETAPDGFPIAPASDLAWFPAAAPLDDGSLVTIARGPGAELSAGNPGSADVELRLEPLDGGDPLTLVVPADGGASIAVRSGATYRVTGGSLPIVVSLAEPGRLAAYAATSPRPLAGPILIRLR